MSSLVVNNNHYGKVITIVRLVLDRDIEVLLYGVL